MAARVLQEVPQAADQFGLQAARTLLREGAFVGLRDNIRAIGEYSEAKIGKEAAKAQTVDFFKAIETLDGTLFQVRTLVMPRLADTCVAGRTCMRPTARVLMATHLYEYCKRRIGANARRDV
jgi:hypothetical protein